MNENLEAFYERLQDRTDAKLIHGMGARPARVMLVLGKPTALSTVVGRIDVGTVRAFLHNLSIIYPLFSAHLYTTLAIKHQNMTWSRDSVMDLKAEHIAAGSPPVLVLAGGAGYLAQYLKPMKVHWVPSIANTILRPEESFKKWYPVHQAYNRLFPDE